MLVKLEFFSGESLFLLGRLKQSVNGGRNAYKVGSVIQSNKKYS
jgi:hypothetical protein